MVSTPTSVLIVDDTPEFVDAVKGILQEQGYLVFSASTGAAALEIVQSGFHGVLILDIQLPDCEGLELFQDVLKFGPGNPAHQNSEILTRPV